MRAALLKSLYQLFPFDLRGDCLVPPKKDAIRISCVINFYGRLDLLQGILYSLLQQDFDRTLLEVVLVEDRNGTPEGRALAEEFGKELQVCYHPLDKNFGMMGYSRNFGLARSRGEIVLFLDDDTVITQTDFLAKLHAVFTENPRYDAVVPHGRASFALVEDRYDFHDPYFMTSRCMAYKRSALQELAGFMNHFVGQEDVEFVIRFFMAGKVSAKEPLLNYFHPPLLVPNFRKPQAVGHSFCTLRKRYPFIVWLLVIANCSRHALLYLFPPRRFREMGRFGIGFITGVVASFFSKDGFRYS
jgi:glycosyltransferase involved in cell wall biosynthesis